MIPYLSVDKRVKLDMSVCCPVRSAMRWTALRLLVEMSCHGNGTRTGELLRILAEEWKARDLERETLTSRKVQEYDKLEKQLRSTIKRVEEREAAVRDHEQEVARMQDDLQRQYEHKLNDARDASRRLRSDVEHEVDLHKRKCADLDTLVAQAQQDRARLQEQLRKLEADFLSYRQEVAAMPVSKIQEENTRLRTENLDLSRRLDSTTQGKQRYKLQWSKALAEISALKKQYMQTNKDVLRREQKELRHLRLQYLAREEHDILHGDRSELHAIRDELAHLRTAAANSAGAHATSHAPSHAHGGTAPAVVAGGGHIGSARSGGEPLTQATGHGTTNTKATNALRRMIEERSTLLRSGIYSAEDRIIKELDNKIRDLLPNH
eukprot:m.362812 g.362812  ORF g.362812 m.362812 type:complete len:379 (+) comp20790_c0_seq1:53-1189(+)